MYLSGHIKLTLHGLNFFLDNPQLFFKLFSLGLIGSLHRLEVSDSVLRLARLVGELLHLLLDAVHVCSVWVWAVVVRSPRYRTGNEPLRSFTITEKALVALSHLRHN